MKLLNCTQSQIVNEYIGWDLKTAIEVYPEWKEYFYAEYLLKEYKGETLASLIFYLCPNIYRFIYKDNFDLMRTGNITTEHRINRNIEALNPVWTQLNKQPNEIIYKREWEQDGDIMIDYVVFCEKNPPSWNRFSDDAYRFSKLKGAILFVLARMGLGWNKGIYAKKKFRPGDRIYRTDNPNDPVVTHLKSSELGNCKIKRTYLYATKFILKNQDMVLQE